MPRSEHESKLVAQLLRFKGWRLWLLFSVAAVLAALAIVTLMSLALQGRVTGDYLLTGLVAASVVAPVTLLLMGTLLKELAVRQQQVLSRSVESAEARLRVALDSSDEGILMVATDGTVLSANQRFFELWQVPPALAAAGQDQLLLAHVLDQLLDPDGFMAGVHRLYNSHKQATDTLRFKDGRVFERYTRELAQGTEQGRIWCFRDVTAQAQTRQALAEREELYRAIVNQAGEGIDLVDAETLLYVEVNEAACRVLGYRREELVGQSICMVLAPRTEASLRQAVAQVVQDGEAKFEVRHRCKDGRVVEVSLSSRAIRLHGRTCLVDVWHDISESQAAHEALQDSRNLLQAIIDAAPMRVFWKDQNLRYLGCNPAFARDAGKNDPSELLGLDDFQLAWADQAEAYRADDRWIMESGQARLSFDEPQTTPDGRTIWLRTSKVPLRNQAQQPIGVLGVYEDITERKQVELALREREQYQRALLDNFPFAVWLKDEHSRFVAVNATFAKVFGWPSPESLVGKTDDDIAPPELARSYRAADQAVLQSGRSQQVEELIETAGRSTWFETYKSPVSIGGRVFGTVGFARDISARKEAERNLKMAVEVAQVVFWKIDLLTQAVDFDQANLDMLGLEPDPGLRTVPGWTERVHPEDQGRFTACLEAALQPGDPVFDLEYRMRRADGQTQWIQTKGSVIHRGVDGQPQLAVGASMNITARKRIEQAARVSEARSRSLATLLRLMADNVPDMIWAKDLDNRYLFANRAVCRQLLNAADTSEPVGRNDMFFALRERARHADNPQWHTFGELCEDSDTATLKRGVPSVFEESGSLQGRLTTLDVHKAPFLDENGRVIGTVGSARDITDRKHTEAELARHRQHLEELVEQRTTELLATEARATRILDSAADGLYGVDADGHITFINHAACRMLGYSAEQVLGHGAHELFHYKRPDGRPYPACECSAHQAWPAGQETRINDETYWHADGHAVPVALASHPIVEKGRIVGAVVSVVDVSLQRAAAAARERALAAAENLARARSEFLANMSHEIRTPMNGVLGFAQIGLRSHDDPDKARNAFEKIIGSGHQLLGVVNEILDFSKIDAGELRIDATEMALETVLQGALQLVADRARAKGLDLRLVKSADLPTMCICDPLRLGQVLLNLLNNAVKFTEAGSVTLSALRQGERLVFSVADTGIGMSADQLDVVFNPFQQADGSTTRKFGGTGLGLAICKRLLELMRGDIHVHSTPGRGSVFEARLPYVPVAEQPPPPAAPPAALPDKPLAGLSILVAEDDEINQMVLEVNLTDSGARLVLVGDGAKAVDRVMTEGPAAFDVVLMDIQMPVMDGYEATRRILELAPGLPVIGQTAHAFNEDRDRCLAAGMAGFIGKPIDPLALNELVLQVLRARHGQA